MWENTGLRNPNCKRRARRLRASNPNPAVVRMMAALRISVVLGLITLVALPRHSGSSILRGLPTWAWTSAYRSECKGGVADQLQLPVNRPVQRCFTMSRIRCEFLPCVKIADQGMVSASSSRLTLEGEILCSFLPCRLKVQPRACQGECQSGLLLHHPRQAALTARRGRMLRHPRQACYQLALHLPFQLTTQFAEGRLCVACARRISTSFSAGKASAPCTSYLWCGKSRLVWGLSAARHIHSLWMRWASDPRSAFVAQSCRGMPGNCLMFSACSASYHGELWQSHAAHLLPSPREVLDRLALL